MNDERKTKSTEAAGRQPIHPELTVARQENLQLAPGDVSPQVLDWLSSVCPLLKTAGNGSSSE